MGKIKQLSGKAKAEKVVGDTWAVPASLLSIRMWS